MYIDMLLCKMEDGTDGIISGAASKKYMRGHTTRIECTTAEN